MPNQCKKVHLEIFDKGRSFCSGRKNQAKKMVFCRCRRTVRYQKRVRMFDKITLRTQLTGIEGRWIYVKQSMWVKPVLR